MFQSVKLVSSYTILTCEVVSEEMTKLPSVKYNDNDDAIRYLFLTL
jgi:hypothetical protein